MPLYLVRHAKAGSRSKWDGPDQLRPLSRPGKEQADALALRLGERNVSRLLSSPYVRCVQTLEPLAMKTGLEIEHCDLLAEASAFAPVLDLLAGLPEGAVLCSHGDVIPDTVDALLRRGMVIDGQPDWRKGSTWVLERRDGGIVRAFAESPPDAAAIVAPPPES